ncbi:U-box domain-containing protein 35, partial [Cucurbita argyrosperma subsp. sororia]
MRKLLLVAATSFVKWEEVEVAGLLCTLGGETPLETPPRESQSPKGERGRSCKCGVEGERAAGRNVKRGGQKNGMKYAKERKEVVVASNQLVGIAIDKDKGSQNALKWATENLLQKSQTAILIHVKLRSSSHSGSSYASSDLMSNNGSGNVLVSNEIDPSTRDLFLPFRCFCTRKDIFCKDIVIEDVDVAKALIEYVTQAGIDTLIVGTTTKSGFLRFKTTDIPGTILKGAPDFCNVYVISRGKIQTMRSASRPAPTSSPLRNFLLNQSGIKSQSSDSQTPQIQRPEKPPIEPARRSHENIEFRSPFTRKGYNGKMPGEMSVPDTDISFVGSGRPSVDKLFPTYYDAVDPGRMPPRLSNGTDGDIYHSFESQPFGRKSLDVNFQEFSSIFSEGERLSTSSQSMEEVEAEMRRLKLELKQTMEMYSTACKEALTAKQKAIELQRWKSEEERRIEEARLAEEAALAMVEQEKAKSRAAMEAAEASKRIAELEAQKRINAEIKAFKEAEEKKKALDALANNDVRYRRYTIEEIEAATEFFSESLKIGEGGYGPVYKGYLDHTPVAIKVLRPDAAQGRSQFQQEVEVLSCIRHPNMVLLLGACPEYGCLVYEFMANGSLDDCLFRRKEKSKPLSWQLRFKIAAEIGTSLLFLHQTKPEPLVHRDLKPANILLDFNYVSKISDVGLARLVPPSVADSVTQYRMTSTAGTFCYIDPEYQQTGMLGVKSDIYSLGIMFLQLITAKPPMGLTHHVGRAIEKGDLSEVLDPSVLDWPAEETLCFAELALKCAELRRKDRPDLSKTVLPELIRLRSVAEASLYSSDKDGV